MMADDPGQLALELVRSRRTLVLATGGSSAWAAPVYYLYDGGRFHFFSSEKSRHVTDAMAAGQCGAAIFRDAEDWRDIEGVQMDGALEVAASDESSRLVFARYVERFPTVRSFLPEGELELDAFLAQFRARLYAFAARRVFYLNNRAGFATRREVEIPE